MQDKVKYRVYSWRNSLKGTKPDRIRCYDLETRAYSSHWGADRLAGAIGLKLQTVSYAINHRSILKGRYILSWADEPFTPPTNIARTATGRWKFSDCCTFSAPAKENNTKETKKEEK